ncbi:hypothetical protein ACH5RR_006259 [Cinchona calisaya]|uniref:Uncharacterized protein n=1 Tax=Cinchona calisaya TaxID=153742 RepID=A0ABD3ANH9_9GENT
MEKSFIEHSPNVKTNSNQQPIGAFYVGSLLFPLYMQNSRMQHISYPLHREPSLLEKVNNEKKKMYRKEAILRWKKKRLTLGILGKQKTVSTPHQASIHSSSIITG